MWGDSGYVDLRLPGHVPAISKDNWLVESDLLLDVGAEECVEAVVARLECLHQQQAHVIAIVVV
jgi:hypothetical protein